MLPPVIRNRVIVTNICYAALEHRGGEGVAVELFELGVDRFVVCGILLLSHPQLTKEFSQQTIQDT